MKLTKNDMKKAIRENHSKIGIYCIDDLKSKTKGYFFSKDSMKFWASKVINEVFCSSENCYFVTSETNFDRTKRAYTVRKFNNGNIKTVGEFLGYESKTLALTECLRLAYNDTMNEKVV